MKTQSPATPDRSTSPDTNLKPLAQAIAVVCAGMAANSVYADSCTTASTVITGSVQDVCLLDTGESVSVTSLATLSSIGNVPGVAATGTSVAGSITNNGTIAGLNLLTNDGATDIALMTALGVFIGDTSTLSGGILNNGTILGQVAGTAAVTAPLMEITITASYGTGIAVENSGILSGGVTNNSGGVIAGLAEARIYGATSAMPGAVTSDAYAYARIAYGIYVDTLATLNGGISNHGTIKGHAIADILVAGATSSVVANVYSAYGLFINGTYNDGGVGLVNTGTISGIASATAVVQAATDLYWVAAGYSSGSYAYGAYFGPNADIAGDITNSGMIEGRVLSSASAYGTGTAATMSYATAKAYSAYGLYLKADVTGEINNSGTIAGEASATIHLENFGTFNNNPFASASSACSFNSGDPSDFS